MKRGTWNWGGLSLVSLSLALILLSPAKAADAPPAKLDTGKADAAKQDSVKTDSGKSDSGKQESARARYARAYLALAKLEVQIAEARNKQVAGTLPPAIMIVLQQRVALAEQWLKAAQPDSDTKPGDIAIKIGEIYLKTAEANLAQGERVNRVSPQRPGVMERLHLKVDLAQSALAAAKELDVTSPDAIFQFQIDRLREEVADMHIQEIKLLDRN